MILLSTNQELEFYIDKKFNIKYLSPILRFVQWKLENNKWDDYNELYHASRLIKMLKTHDDIWLDSHLLFKSNKMIGVLFIVGGNVSKLVENISIRIENKSLLLKYFHIVEKGNGFGSLWLRSVVIPYYGEKGYKQIYVNSSHKDSFPFYSRLGEKISDYKQESDNQINKRCGSSFLIKIGG